MASRTSISSTTPSIPTSTATLRSPQDLTQATGRAPRLRVAGWDGGAGRRRRGVCAPLRHRRARWADYRRRGRPGFCHATAYIRYDPQVPQSSWRPSTIKRPPRSRAGREPADAGMPGWPLPPVPRSSHRIPRQDESEAKSRDDATTLPALSPNGDPAAASKSAGRAPGAIRSTARRGGRRRRPGELAMRASSCLR